MNATFGCANMVHFKKYVFLKFLEAGEALGGPEIEKTGIVINGLISPNGASQVRTEEYLKNSQRGMSNRQMP